MMRVKLERMRDGVETVWEASHVELEETFLVITPRGSKGGISIADINRFGEWKDDDGEAVTITIV